MATITIRGLDENVKKRLQKRAAKHGRSMEQEAREILKLGLATPEPPGNLGTAIHELFAPLGGVDLPEFPDQPIGEPVRFDE